MNARHVSVVVPTYRERDNLCSLLPTLFAVFDRADLDAEVIVVDDDSCDGTEAICTEHAGTKPVRLVVRRGERGLASAVLRGLREARGEICVVMDADFSHPPESVPRLVAAVSDPQCEMAIGSRYIDGGAVDRNWSWFRRLNSRVASLLAVGLTSAADPMSGFFALRKSTFERATELRPLGYKVGLELIVRCDCRNIVEVPITFRDRAAGTSKLSLAQQWLYLRHLRRLYTATLMSHPSARYNENTDAAEHRKAA